LSDGRKKKYIEVFSSFTEPFNYLDYKSVYNFTSNHTYFTLQFFRVAEMKYSHTSLLCLYKKCRSIKKTVFWFRNLSA